MTASVTPTAQRFSLAGSDTALTAGEVAAFLLGAVTWFPVQLGGRVYLGEVGLAICAIALPVLWQRVRRRGAGQRTFTWLIVLFAGYFMALVLTDLYRGTGAFDYSRGWARALFLFTNTVGLLAIGHDRPRQLIAWIAGQALSGLVIAGLEFGEYGLIRWKFGLALPVTIGALVFLNSRRTAWAVAVLLGLGAVNLLFDYRSLAGFCCAAALLVYYAARRTRWPGWRAAVPAGLLAAAVVGGFAALYASGTLLGDPTFGQDVFERRRGSNIERLAGLLIGVQAVRASPVIGYGSWARSSELFDDWLRLQEGMGSPIAVEQKALGREERGELDAIPTHSQVLQGWVEAGIPGLIFFGFLLVALGRMLIRLVRRETMQRPFALAALWGIWAMWAIAMSPFGGGVRLHNAIAFALLFVLAFARGGLPVDKGRVRPSGSPRLRA